ncbi:SIR2 family protein [Desulfopila inferna]|uniref:SIR2 family protein n=1 Tax=Desulfopila inferna TaxID=468528 RepID=UPI001962DA0A|nr:SIR2 family protein [Desulfopila inferna]MBM9604114.1 SIR2 family protein [Desulfopila inferna]
MHNLTKELNEIRNQLSYSKRLGLFLGAGTSKSIGISDIAKLTKTVEKNLNKADGEVYEKLKLCFPDDSNGYETIEDYLNQLRLIRKITFEQANREFHEIDGEQAKELDIRICSEIYKIISAEEEMADPTVPLKFAAWLNWLSRDYPKEIFTTNYDLIFEKAFESLMIPYFDGFVGSYEPFFLPETIEKEATSETPPSSWIRLWKLHGSLSWFWKPDSEGNKDRIIRLGSNIKPKGLYDEIVIYPSREKYESSRKQPFISYFDRLKSFLNDGERLFIINGYSFSDDHINAQIFDSLRHNNRLHVMVFFYSDKSLEKLVKEGRIYPNLSVYGAKKAIINGIVGKWDEESVSELSKDFWDNTKKKLMLGDFKELIRFFLVCSGRKEKLEEEVS